MPCRVSPQSPAPPRTRAGTSTFRSPLPCSRVYQGSDQLSCCHVLPAGDGTLGQACSHSLAPVWPRVRTDDLWPCMCCGTTELQHTTASCPQLTGILPWHPCCPPPWWVALCCAPLLAALSLSLSGPVAHTGGSSQPIGASSPMRAALAWGQSGPSLPIWASLSPLAAARSWALSDVTCTALPEGEPLAAPLTPSPPPGNGAVASPRNRSSARSFACQAGRSAWGACNRRPRYGRHRCNFLQRTRGNGTGSGAMFPPTAPLRRLSTSAAGALLLPLCDRARVPAGASRRYVPFVWTTRGPRSRPSKKAGRGRGPAWSHVTKD